jgi:hypothetical protein
METMRNEFKMLLAKPTRTFGRPGGNYEDNMKTI